MPSNADEFIGIFKECIERPGADELLDWLKTTDFFTAPASTKFHGNYAGGLVEHSLHVLRRLASMCKDEYDNETLFIVSLLHDVCKANFYGVEYRNRKNQYGQWEKYPVYVVKDEFPYGHGEKSVLLISRYIKLTDEEAMAIRWHMGGFDCAVKGGEYAMGEAYNKYPLAVYLHCADMQASYLDDKKEE